MSTTAQEIIITAKAGNYKVVKADRLYAKDKLLGFQMEEREYDLYKRILNLAKVAIVAMALIYGVQNPEMIIGLV